MSQTDEGLSPRADDMVKEAKERLGTYMKHCDNMINEHEQAAKFWHTERLKVHEFLTGNQMMTETTREFSGERYAR